MIPAASPGHGSPPPRLLSLDQFRGFAVAAMFVVNFLGGYSATPSLLRHHNTWCSLADLVMPCFFFAAGMALRLVVLREAERRGRPAALRRSARRALALILLGFLWYGPAKWHSWNAVTSASAGELLRGVFLTNAFQTLTHLGFTCLWVLPVIACSARTRIAWAAGSAALHGLLSYWFWYETLQRWRVIDGGPLGFLTWTLPLIAGSVAFDALRPDRRVGGLPAARPAGPVAGFLVSAVLLMAAGYGLACFTAGGVMAAPPLIPPWHPVDLWTMSQRAGSVSYLTFSTGAALALFAWFRGWCDLRGKSLTLFSDLGRNALAAYLLHMVMMGVTERIGPDDAPLWWALTLSSAGFLLSWGLTRLFNSRGWFLRL